MKAKAQTRTTLIDRFVRQRFNGMFFMALGILVMLRTLTYVLTTLVVDTGMGHELNPLAQFTTAWFFSTNVVFAAPLFISALFIGMKEIRAVLYSCVIAIVFSDLFVDTLQFSHLPESLITATSWVVAALIPTIVAVRVLAVKPQSVGSS